MHLWINSVLITSMAYLLNCFFLLFKALSVSFFETKRLDFSSARLFYSSYCRYAKVRNFFLWDTLHTIFHLQYTEYFSFCIIMQWYVYVPLNMGE